MLSIFSIGATGESVFLAPANHYLMKLQFRLSIVLKLAFAEEWILEKFGSPFYKVLEKN